jgi:hypothetical protein
MWGTMNIFTTSISSAINNNSLEKGSFACDKEGRLVVFGAFSKKVVSRLPNEIKDKLFGINSRKLSLLITKYQPESEIEQRIFEDNVNYLKTHGFVPVEDSSREQLRANIKKASEILHDN